jgi:hypothetical protein
MDETSNAHDRERYPAPSPILVGVSTSGDVGRRADVRPLPSLTGPIPALFCVAGGVLCVVGALPWIAALAGADGLTWPVLVLAALALVVGVFTVLVGIGLFRARRALHAAEGEARLDAELTAAAEAHAGAAPGHDACAADTACAGCDATCALNALRS